MLRLRTTQRALFALAIVAAAMVSGPASLHAQPLSAEPLFVEGTVDNSRPYLGQQITYIFKAYLRSDLSLSTDQLEGLRYEPPNFSGFWTYQATEPREFTEEVDASEYRVIEIQTALFPSVVGEIEIGASKLTVPAGSSGTPTILESASMIVDVRPLPTGAPAEFAGAVGSFDITAEVDAETGKVNEAVQLTVRISGEGNIETLPDPVWPEFVDWRVVELPAAADAQVVDGRITGIRTYEIAMVPTISGQLAIPEITYTYFYPTLKEYVTASAAPILVSVSEVDGSSPPQQSLDAEAVVVEDDSDVRQVKAVPASLRRARTELTDSAVYWAGWGIPALAIAAAVAWRRKRDAEEASLETSRRRNALPNARATLARAASSGDDPMVAVADVVQHYLSARLGIALGGLTREELGRQLQNAGVPADLCRLVDDVLVAGEAARYTPQASSNAGRTDQIERADQLLVDLDGAIVP